MFKFPFGTMNELNLNWIIQKVKELADATGITKEKLSFLTPNGTETFDGSEPLTIDVQGVDTSGKLDKYEGGTDSIYGTLGSNQVNFPVPLPAERGGTGVTSLTNLETSMNLSGKYVGRKTTAGGLYAYGHNGNTEKEIPVEVSPAPAGIPYRDANGNVRTNTPDGDNDAVNKKYFSDNTPSAKFYNGTMYITTESAAYEQVLSYAVPANTLFTIVMRISYNDSNPEGIRFFDGAVLLLETGGSGSFSMFCSTAKTINIQFKYSAAGTNLTRIRLGEMTFPISEELP